MILPVDPYVEDSFFETVKEMEKALNQSNSELALMGVKPTYPSEKYGYIVPKKTENSDFQFVNNFREKPDKDTAEYLIKQNALWNCGVFAFKMGYIIDLLVDKELPIKYNDLIEQYEDMKKTSFDYEVVEKTENIAVIPYNGYWKDLGTWNTLTEEMSNDIIGNGKMEGSINSHILNETNIPITLLGLDNTVVAASSTGILVSDKESSPKIKEYIDDTSEHLMYAEEFWGSYWILNHSKYVEGTESLTKQINLTSKHNLPYKVHYNKNKVWTIVRGEGTVVLDTHVQEANEGDVIQISFGVKHAIRAITNLEIIEVQIGTDLLKIDPSELAYNWDDITDITNGLKVYE
ncbi:mannose-6-phosphate isomerase [Gracilibacillus halophilus YIM-C55.5]|uniref:Mannose-6-phosphate isomerase n=1 Tax=Gracilibacillus halophilus YIM-C55.5 TaxID=1308866 RepID=N4WCW4_9BACI|nr:mannose-6-phosphate isomerase [Gracilibacillus halophilus YIM-C55.5]